MFLFFIIIFFLSYGKGAQMSKLKEEWGGKREGGSVCRRKQGERRQCRRKQSQLIKPQRPVCEQGDWIHWWVPMTSLCNLLLRADKGPPLGLRPWPHASFSVAVHMPDCGFGGLPSSRLPALGGFVSGRPVLFMVKPRCSTPAHPCPYLLLFSVLWAAYVSNYTCRFPMQHIFRV